MTKSFAAVLACSAAALLTNSCITRDVGHPMNEAFAFRSDQDERQLEKHALAGDIQAAQFLADHYLWFDYNKTKALHWLKVAAHNGSKTARHSIKVVEESDR